MKRILPSIALAVALPASAWAQAATPTTGSAACATLAQAAADGLNARVAANNASISPPASVMNLSCLQNFFSGVGLNLITSLINPASIVQSVEGQICQAVNTAWQNALGTAQCGLTLTGFNLGFGIGLGGGTMCPKLSFGGGGPPLGSVSTGYNTQEGYGLYINGQSPTVPTGYSALSSDGSF